ncbi:unnamed protein product [Kluyveromyces dobzhanskii CBS 2104]|uniref:WGS project CCBQ000000000 data, contig 00098 n=1 Tax=Kluyveromyces dobzhanskii CBS 2104 TaxID=1427455 RepID=A0A0A8L3E0_9SACH|nr:unnamed protein product [Kluyveromyces dobzhanskii CBS 2104]
MLSESVKSQEETEKCKEKDMENEDKYDSTHDSTLPEHKDHEWSSSLKEIAFVMVLCSAQLMTQAGLAQSIAPLHIIGDSFDIDNPGQLSWFPSAFSLTVGTFILIAGRLGDLFGHKRFFVAGFLWYGLWSLLAGFSVYSNQIFFDCCRAFQGIGPAFAIPNAIAIIARTYKRGNKQNMIFSLFGACAPSGFVIGAVFSSLLSQYAWWPWAYWIMSITCVLLGIAGFLIIPHHPPIHVVDKSISVMERIDVAGSVTGVVGLVLFNFAWNQGPVVGWDTPYTYILLIVGTAFLGLFGFVESRAKQPLLPVSTLTSDTFFVMGCIAAGWSSFGIWLYYTWQLMENLRGQSPLTSSAQFVPCAISGLCAALSTGFFLSRTSPSTVMIIAMVSFTIGNILVATVPVHQSYWAQTFVSILVMPWGMDMSFPAATIILSNAMPASHQGLAASLVNTIINYSISIGLGFAGTIESQISVENNLLKGYRGAYYMGIGLAGLGIGVAISYSLFHNASTRRPVRETHV